MIVYWLIALATLPKKLKIRRLNRDIEGKSRRIKDLESIEKEFKL